MNEIQFKLQEHLYNSRWICNMQTREMFDLDINSHYANVFSYSNFRREIMDVSQNIKASIEKELIQVIQNENK